MQNLKLVAWLVFVALVLECLSRAASTLSDQLTAEGGDEWYIPSPSLGWTRRPNFSGIHSCATQANFDERGYFSADSHQVDDFSQQRVVFIGDSNTFGFCLDPPDTFVEVVDEQLPEASAINAAVAGYSSFQGYKTLLEYGDALKPDVLVVSFNFNDRRYVLDIGPDSNETFEQRYAARSRYEILQTLRASYFVRLLNFLLVKVGLAPERADPLSISVEGLAPRVSPEAYRQNLQNIVDWADERGVDVVLLLLGDNPTTTSALNRGIELLQAGDTVAAIDALRVASLDVVFGPLARKYLSEAYRTIGDTAKAEQVLRVKPLFSEQGGYPLYTDSHYHDLMREIARTNDVPVVDGDALLALTPGDYLDSVHFDAQGQRKVAELLLPTIRELLKQRR
jgi:lysophospholipase L1-like esterase